MIEIFILIYLSRKVGTIAEEKGLKARTWKIYTVLAWLGSELAVLIVAGIMLGMSGVDVENPMINLMFVPVGLAAGYAGYLLVKQRLESHEDVDPWKDKIDEIGRRDDE